ncbi:MAG: hypothetical protein QOK43_2199 [Acidimicrobiaceae bacterium]|nr:hypothetical protein [Acidimicrobiaceae bacterium]
MASVSTRTPEAKARVRRAQLLVYAGRNEVAARQDVHLRRGIIFHGRLGAVEAAGLRSRGFTGALAVDPERYTKLNEQPPRLISDADLCATEQATLGVSAYFAPSFATQRTQASLLSVLEDGASFLSAVERTGASAPAYVSVVVTPFWLSEGLDVLETAVRDFARPIAFVFAAPFDPLGSQAAVEGALRLIQASAGAFILRCDLSAIGLVAGGAMGGSVGASATTRHLGMPLRNARRDRSSRDNSLHVFVPRLLSWPRGSTLEHLADDLDVFVCRCGVCQGDSLLRFREASRAVEAERHAVAAWAAIADAVLGDNDPIARWRSVLESADNAYGELEADGVALGRPGFIRAWLSVLPA